jgi:hypothetical protein
MGYAVSVRSLSLAVADRVELQTLFDQDLSKGRAFVPGATGVAEFEACELWLEHAGRTHKLRAEVVFIKLEGLGCGVGLQLSSFDAAALAELTTFVHAAMAKLTEPAAPEGGAGTESVKQEVPERGAALSMHDRVRMLTPVEQQKVAANGTLPERVALERIFGPNVWEALLGNPRLTLPEVATIARKGTVPRTTIENLAGHASWLAAPEVQRALLSNPRSTTAVIGKVLQVMARSELLLVSRQTSYSHAVRAAAKKKLEEA